VKTTVVEQEGNKVKLDLEIPADEVERAFNRAASALSREVRIHGFRKGKIPKAVILQRLGAEAVAQRMLEDSLPGWYETALKESGVEPIGQPDLDVGDLPAEGSPFSFSATVEVVPEPVLGQYKDLEVPKGEVEVRDEDVDAQVERLRDQFAELRSAPAKTVAEGDYVTVDFVGMLDGEPVEDASAEDYLLQLGSGQVMPEVEEGLTGMGVGDERLIPVDYPDDFPDESCAGKTLEFKVTVKDVKEKVLPALSDEFAKDVSEFATLLELRLDIRKKIESSMQSAVDQRFRQAAVQAAVDRAEVDVPEVLVNQQTGSMFEDFVRSLQMRGGDFEQYLEQTGTDAETLAKDMRPAALNAAKTGIVLDAVARAEGVQVEDETLDKMIEALAKGAKESDPAQLRSRLEESGRIDELRRSLMRDKAVDIIVSSGVPVPMVDSPDDALEVEAPAEKPSQAETPSDTGTSGADPKE
jgi:trigger factor